MPVRAAGLRGKTVDHHVRLKFADHAHDVGQHCLLDPRCSAFRGSPWKNRNPSRAKKTAGPVEPAGGEQFLRASDAELFAELRAEHVLTAIAARKRKIGGAVVSSAREIGDEQCVFAPARENGVDGADVVAMPFENRLAGIKGDPQGGAKEGAFDVMHGKGIAKQARDVAARAPGGGKRRPRCRG